MPIGFAIVVMVTWLFMPTWAVGETSETVNIPVAGGRSLSGELFLPDGDAYAPAIMILHTAFGSVEPSDSDYARALAKTGFVTLTVNYLHPETFNGRAGFAQAIVNDLVEAAKWLAARPQVRGKPIGTVGFSLGSIGLLMAARYPDIKAVVVYYGAYDPRKFGRASPGSKARYPIDAAPEVNAATLLLHGDADDETPIADAQGMKASLASNPASK
jgi:dienelactone hydrolase